MKVINASFEILNEPDLLKKIEQVARLCYKSEDKITEGSDIALVKMLLDRNHLAMLEHGVITLEVDGNTYCDLITFVEEYHTQIGFDALNCNNVLHNNYLKFTETESGNSDPDTFLVTGNVRAWYETLTNLKEAFDYLPYKICEVLKEKTKGLIDLNAKYNTTDEEVNDFVNVVEYYNELSPQERMTHEHITVLFNVDRGVTHELVRMRECSFAQESTRYCNYSKGKFGSEITVIKPCFFDKGTTGYGKWSHACEVAEEMYLSLIDGGATPQQARDVLPQSVKASIYVTANLMEWYHIFNLRACRATGPAHPQMEEVMIPLLKVLREIGYSFAFNNLIAVDEL